MNGAFRAQELRLALLALLIAFVCSAGLFLGVKLLLAKLRKRPVSRVTRRAAVFFIGLLLIGVGCFVYALTIEADWLQVTRVEVRTPRLPEGSRLRIVHLSDLHVDGWTRALTRLPDEVNALQPDLLVFTGDSLNSEAGLPVLREVLSRIQTRYGRFAIRGNHDVWYWHVSAGEPRGTPTRGLSHAGPRGRPGPARARPLPRGPHARGPGAPALLWCDPHHVPLRQEVRDGPS